MSEPNVLSHDGTNIPVVATTTTTAVAEWPTDPTLYELSGKIGQGAFATVWKATREGSIKEREEQHDPNRPKYVCAVKILNLDHVDTNLAEIRLEVQAMRLLSHPNVLTCYTAFANHRELWLVTPLMTKGSSLNCLQSARRTLRKKQQQQQQEGNESYGGFRMEPHILFIVHETLLGLQYIHENGQIHRDIKAGNILVDGNGDVRIADFGVSGFLVQAGSQQEKAKTFVGTPCWMSPEVMEQMHGYDYKADIWSLGITALELAKGYAPYAKFPPMKVLILTIQENPPSLASYDEENDDDDLADEVWEDYSKQFSAFVDMCLQKNPVKRPNCSELLSSRYFSAFQDASYRRQQQDAMCRDVCSLVQDVAYKQEEAAKRAQAGHTAVTIKISEAENRPKGTTWVFADGSQVLSSDAAPAELEELFDELDTFGQETGGEHYDRGNAATIAKSNKTRYTSPPAAAAAGQDDSHNANDDDDFFDEFERNTAGEDFRRDHPI